MTIIYFIIAIGILVIVHEFGHFITARMSGMRTEVFAFGMGYRLFGWNKITGFTFGSLPKDFDGGDYCDYRVAAFPIGGYVKISGMVDESMDAETMASEPQPHEFRSKNVFQKIITISGGVLMNVILAVIIFSIIVNIQGKEYKATTKIATVVEKSIAHQMGLQQGDEIKSINGQEVKTWDQVEMGLFLDNMGEDRKIVLKRASEEITLTYDGSKLVKMIANKTIPGIAPYNARTLITSVVKDKPAEKLGIKSGDTVLAVNNIPCPTTFDFQKVISSNPNKTVLLTWKRDYVINNDSITPNEDGIIGVGISDVYVGPKFKEEFNFFGSITEGFNATYKSMDLIIGSFAQMINGNVSVKQSVGGPIAIAKMASQEAQRGVLSFLNFLALLSLMLAIINILPLPALDGGHLVIIIIEAIIRRELPFKVKMAIQQVGMIILLMFMAFVIYVDLTR